MALHDAHLKTTHLQLQRDDLGHQKILAVRGCKPEATKEEPFCQLKKMAIINESVSRSKPSTKSQYAKSDAARLQIYNDCDSLCCMLSDHSHKVCAARTPPANANKYKKRLGAKQSKNLEKLESVGFELNPTEATLYRALSARCNYLAQDRCDIAFAAKELCREFAIPSKLSYARLKRLVRWACLG